MPHKIIPFLLIGCSAKTPDFGPGDDPETDPSGLHASCKADSGLILDTPDEDDFAEYYAEGFDRYTYVAAPNGGIIPIFAQSDITEGQLLRARGLLSFFLSDTPNSRFGADKSEVANAMVNNGAVLMMPNGEHEEGNEPDLNAQPLYFSETPEDGSEWFLNNNFQHRDAAFEEIFHLVHDQGIGSSEPAALPDYQELIRNAAEEAIANGIWGRPLYPEVAEWLEELRKEDSLAQEYIASVIDSYYGLWGPWEQSDGGMWGIYIAKDRQEIEQRDPIGLDLVESFLSPYLTQEIRLDDSLDQDILLEFDANIPYTHKSRYFVNVTLQGSNDIGIHGNDQDNTLRGNVGDNHLFGGEGQDTAVYCNPFSSYALTWESEVLIVEGQIDGVDRLESIEWLHFADGLIKSADLQ